MTRLLIGWLLILSLLAACAPATLSQRELVGGVFVVGYRASTGALIEALATGGLNVQPGRDYGFLNLTSRSSNAVVLAARRLQGVGQLTNEALATEIWIQATIRQDGGRAIVTFRGEPALATAVADARRGLVALLDARFPRAELDPEQDAEVR